MKKNYIRFLAGVFSVWIFAISSGIVVSTLSAENENAEKISLSTSSENSSQTKPSFLDISENDWYYSSVQTLTEMGIINGYPDGSFRPTGEITCAEFTKLLLCALNYEIDEDGSRMSSSISVPATQTTKSVWGTGRQRVLYIRFLNDTPLQKDDGLEEADPMPVLKEESGKQDFDFSISGAQHWAQPYIDVAVREGILTTQEIQEYEPDTRISRSLMVRMMARALHFDPIVLEEKDFPFADEADEYAVSAWVHYLLNGYLENGVRYFKGENGTIRAEAAAIVLRAYEYTQNTRQFKEMALVQKASVLPLNNKIELIDYFCLLNREFTEQVQLNSELSFAEWTEIYKIAAGLYPEHIVSRGYQCSYHRNGNRFVIDFIYEADREELQQMREEAEKIALDIANSIVLQTSLPTEQVKLAHDYIIEHCQYDYENYVQDTIPFASYTAYGALVMKTAVCKGYSAAFNMICHNLGIDSYSVSGKDPNSDEFHMWNAVRLDGVTYFVDVTFDDPVTVNEENMLIYDHYLCTPDQFSEKGYTWDESAVDDLYYELLY